MLRGFDFHPVPGHPRLYVLADQQHDGRGRATRAVDLLRRANYQVQADAEFDPPPPSPKPTPSTAISRHVEPDVAFAEHPRLGIVAATADGAVLGGQLLEEHGWRRNPDLDIYTLTTATSRSEALGKLAQATAAMHRADLHVAVQPALADDVTARRPPSPTRSGPRGLSQSAAARRFPTLKAAALARTSRLGTAPNVPIRAPVASAPATRPADPRPPLSPSR
jgi:hypothetical protein